MDRPHLSAAIIEELGQLFVTVLKDNSAKLMDSDLDGIEQRLQDIARTVFGPVVEHTVAAIAAGLPGEPPKCPRCHLSMRLVDYSRPRRLLGLVGEYGISRAYFVCGRCHEGCAPLDERLGIGSGVLSPGLERVTCRLGIEDSFYGAADALKDTLRIELPSEASRRVTEGIGQVAEEEAQGAIALAEAGKDPLPAKEVNPSSPVLLVEVDGAMVHETDGNWHEVKCGLAAAIGPQAHEEKKTGRATLEMGKPSYCAGFESAEAFWHRVYVEACRQGLGSLLVSMVVVLGDGADWIWRHAGEFLAVDGVKLVEILDIYHAFEHLGEVARAVFGEGNSLGKEWSEPLKERLQKEGPAPILAALAELRPEDAVGSEVVRKALGYFTENAARMDYPTFIALKLPIGSGAIESTCKTLIEKREKGAGMRWTEKGAQSVATLRALHRSGRWDEFWQTHPQRRRPAVFPNRRPHPAPVPFKKQAA